MNKGQRAFALIAAVLFLGTSVGFSAYVIWEMSKNKDQAKLQTINESDNTKEEETMLQGTKLAGFTPLNKIEQLQSIDLVVGTGPQVSPGATITAHYTGALASDGTIFQSSLDRGEPATFGLDQVIKGWTDGVPGMKVGGKRRLLIPAAQAYGPNERPGIPANSDLVFDIELVSLQ